MNPHPFVTRRQALQQLACGFGYLAFAGLAAQAAARNSMNPLAARPGHLPPKAKRVIFLFMGGGVSHLDSFDYKPTLYTRDGEMMEFLDQRAIAKTGAGSTQRRGRPPDGVVVGTAAVPRLPPTPSRPSRPLRAVATSSPSSWHRRRWWRSSCRSSGSS